MTIDVTEASKRFQQGYYILDHHTRTFRTRESVPDEAKALAASKGADDDTYKVSVKLFPGNLDEPLIECNAAFKAIGAVVDKYCVKMQPLGPGTAVQRVMSKQEFHFGKFYNAFEAAKQTAYTALDDLCREWPNMIAQAQAQRPGVTITYPPDSELRERFSFELVGPHTPPAITDIDRSTLPAAVTDDAAEALIANRSAQIEAGLKSSMTLLAEQLVDNLRAVTNVTTKIANEEPTRVKKSLQNNLMSTLEMLENNNLFESEKLNRLVEITRNTINAMPLNQVKGDPDKARKLAQSAQKIADLVEEQSEDILF